MFHDFVEPRIHYAVTISRDDIPDKFVRILTRAKKHYWYRLWCGFMYLFVMDNSMASKIGFSLVRDDTLLRSCVISPTHITFSGVDSTSQYVLALIRFLYRPKDRSQTVSIQFWDETSPFSKNKYTITVKSYAA